MKQLLGLAIVFFAGSAHAQPAEATAASTYVAAGAVVGRDQGGFYLGPSVEIGGRLSGSLWMHGMVEYGEIMGDEPYSDALFRTVVLGSRLTVRGGLEQRLVCGGRGTSHGVQACLVAGLDGGYRREQFAAEYGPRPPIDDVVVFERIGLDIGGDKVRVRPTIENTSSATSLLEGFAVTANVAFTW